MKWYYNLKIGARLILTFTIVVILASILGIYSYSSLNKLNKETEDWSLSTLIQ